MLEKGFAATTSTDAHGDKLSKKQLIQMANEINEDKYARGAGFAHDLLAMPIGKTIHGEVIPIGANEYGLEIQQELFDKFKIIKSTDGKRYVKAESEIDKRPFIEEISYDNIKLAVSIDKVNFSDDNYHLFWEQFNDNDIEKKALIRKSFLPDPEIVFTLIKGTIYTLSALVAKKTFDKLSDSISEDIEKSYQVIKKAIASFVKLANHNERPITYVFEDNYNDILVQLIVRSNNADKVLMSIEKEKICIIAHKIDELKTQFPINKVQFLYSEENEQWEFRYLTTATGAVIGTKIAFRYTKELISKQPFAQRLDIKLVPQNNNEQ